MREAACARRMLAVCLMAGAFVAWALAPSVGRAAESVAVWSPGDSWQWQGSLSSRPLLMTLTVLDQETVGVSGVAYASYHAKLWNNFTQSGPGSNMTGDIWYRVGDLTVLKSVMGFNVSASGAANYTVAVTYAPVIPLHFPLVTNDTWIATTTATVVATSPSQPASWENITFTMTASVGPTQEYTVGAGTFATTQIAETFTGPYQYAELYFWSSDVGNSVNGPFIAPGVESIHPQGLELAAYRYAPPSPSPPGRWSDPLVLLLVGLIAGVALGAFAVVLLYRRAGRSRDSTAWDSESEKGGSKP